MSTPGFPGPSLTPGYFQERLGGHSGAPTHPLAFPGGIRPNSPSDVNFHAPRPHLPGLFRSGGQTTQYGGNPPNPNEYPGPGSHQNQSGLDSISGFPTGQNLGSLGLAHQLLVQQGTGQGAGLPPLQHLANPSLQAIHIAPFQQAIQTALAQHQAQSQLPPGVGVHPQVDRMHAVHAGSSIAQQLVKHFAGTLARNAGR